MTGTLLHDDQAETCVVGTLLCNEDCYYSVAERIKPYMFFNNKLARIVEVIIALYGDGQNVNIITVCEYLATHKDHNNPEVWEVAEYSSAAIISAFEDSFNVVESLYVRRRYFALGSKLIEFGTNHTTTLEEVRREIDDVLEEEVEKQKRVKSLRDANKELKQRVMKNYDGSSDTMIPTGFKAIDEKGGLQVGDFDVIAAESSAGKTSLLTCIMVNAASAGVPSMLFSMEMMSAQLAARIVSPKAKISSGTIQYKRLEDWQLNELSQALKQTDTLPIYFDDESTISIDSIISSIRRNVKRLKIKLVGIDYLQILCSAGNVKNQEQFLGSIARKLKNLAKELQICIVALSQLARNITDPKPTLSRVRASGQIVEAADSVIMIWRPAEYGKGYDDYVKPDGNSQTAELIIGKGRNIGTFTCIVGFEKSTTYFYNYEGEVQKTGEIHISSVKGKKAETIQDAKNAKQEELFPKEGDGLPF